MPRPSSAGRDALRPHVGDLRQLASVRPIVLDDGQERGVRALAFSTGGGLDFWVLSDRNLDIGPLWWRGTPLAWQSPNGFPAPALIDREGEAGRGFERGFSGLLVTCGLDHIRQPAPGRTLHGRLPFTPGRVTAHGENWDTLRPVLYCEGEVTQARLDGEMLRLRRRIEAPIGGAALTIRDEVENIGVREQELALLYHLNFGFPLVGRGARVSWPDGGDIVPPIGNPSAGAEPVIRCVAASNGGGRCRIDRAADGPWRGVAAEIAFDPTTLPWLQVWTDPRPRRRLIGIEPATSARNDDGSSAPGPRLAPGQVMRFRVDVGFMDIDNPPRPVEAGLPAPTDMPAGPR